MTNIVIVKQSGKKYLFSVPMGTTLKKRDKVVCDTARGEQEGICFTNSFTVENDALNQIALLTGATLPLKSVIGKSEITRFKDKPQENKFEVGQKYKVDEHFYKDGGNIIEITIVDENNNRCFYTIFNKNRDPRKEPLQVFYFNSSFTEYLTPYTEPITVKEVQRQAKAGEYIKLIKNDYIFNEVGDILKVTSTDGIGVCVSTENQPRKDKICDARAFLWYYSNNEYVVLENYTPPAIEEEKAQDKQPKSEYYNGIVVCVDDTDTGFFTKGKVYTFKDGVIIDDQFSPYNDNDPIKKFSDTKDWQPKFSEYKVVKTADVKEPEKHTYKVGDKVEIVKNINQHDLKIGTIGNITDKIGCYWNFSIFNYNGGANNLMVTEEEIKPYTEPKKHVYKNGDYVKIISNKLNSFELGYIVKLNFKADNGWWNCTWTGFDGVSKTQYANEYQFEPFEYKEKIK